MSIFYFQCVFLETAASYNLIFTIEHCQACPIYWGFSLPRIYSKVEMKSLGANIFLQ